MGREYHPDCILVVFVFFTDILLVISLRKMSIIRNMSIIRAPAPYFRPFVKAITGGTHTGPQICGTVSTSIYGYETW